MDHIMVHCCVCWLRWRYHVHDAPKEGDGWMHEAGFGEGVEVHGVRCAALARVGRVVAMPTG